MTVHFIGAGPGAADLITVRGRDILARAPVCHNLIRFSSAAVAANLAFSTQP
jgi:precorrin-4 methylase